MPFEIWEIALILFAGLWAGMINTIVGSGTLVTFPVLISLGVPPVSATMSNAMGLIAGNITGAWAYRAELGHVKSTLFKLLPVSVLGGLIGATLLTRLPESVFGVAAPIFIVVSLFFVVTQPRLQRIVRERKAAEGVEGAAESQPAILYLLVFIAGIYGGYFVAAQGVLLLGILGVFMLASLQAANAVKNALVAAVNMIAAIFYIVTAFDRIWWWVVLFIAVSSMVGSWLGAKIGRRMSPVVLRTVIVILGLVALVNMIRQLL